MNDVGHGSIVCLQSDNKLHFTAIFSTLFFTPHENLFLSNNFLFSMTSCDRTNISLYFWWNTRSSTFFSFRKSMKCLLSHE